MKKRLLSTIRTDGSSEEGSVSSGEPTLLDFLKDTAEMELEMINQTSPTDTTADHQTIPTEDNSSNAESSGKRRVKKIEKLIYDPYWEMRSLPTRQSKVKTMAKLKKLEESERHVPILTTEEGSPSPPVNTKKNDYKKSEHGKPASPPTTLTEKKTKKKLKTAGDQETPSSSPAASPPQLEDNVPSRSPLLSVIKKDEPASPASSDSDTKPSPSPSSSFSSSLSPGTCCSSTSSPALVGDDKTKRKRKIIEKPGLDKTFKCAHCKTQSSPLWRRGWVPEGQTHAVSLCNACGLRYSKNSYCPYCFYIYKDSEDRGTGANKWIGCDLCSRWVHRSCEETYNPGKKDFDFFVCPTCRKNKQNEANESNEANAPATHTTDGSPSMPLMAHFASNQSLPSLAQLQYQQLSHLIQQQRREASPQAVGSPVPPTSQPALLLPSIAVPRPALVI